MSRRTGKTVSIPDAPKADFDRLWDALDSDKCPQPDPATPPRKPDAYFHGFPIYFSNIVAADDPPRLARREE